MSPQPFSLHDIKEMYNNIHTFYVVNISGCRMNVGKYTQSVNNYYC